NVLQWFLDPAPFPATYGGHQRLTGQTSFLDGASMSATKLSSRRNFLRFATATGVVAPFAAGFGIRGASGGEGRITLMGVGGTWGTSGKQLIGEPFEKQYGVSVALDSRPNAQ